jgi:hypothetical protein
VTAADEFVGIARLIDALRPWHAHVVLVGGWAHRLYRFDPRARVPSYRPLQTKDADVAFAPGRTVEGNIGDALRVAGFHEVLSGEHVPPVSEFRLGDEDQGFYAEFLAPLTGSGVKRDGTADATVVHAGVTAQKLRHLDVLLTAPATLELGADTGIPLDQSARILIANPVSFIAQKLLIQKYRTPAKQAQDALYVHDTLELYSSEIERLRTIWNDTVKPAIGDKVATSVKDAANTQYGSLTDVIRSAARIPADRNLDPALIQAMCAYALERLFL